MNQIFDGKSWFFCSRTIGIDHFTVGILQKIGLEILFVLFFLTYNLFFIRACTRSFTGTAADATKPGSTPTAADPTITTASSTTQSRETS